MCNSGSFLGLGIHTCCKTQVLASSFSLSAKALLPCHFNKYQVGGGKDQAYHSLSTNSAASGMPAGARHFSVFRSLFWKSRAHLSAHTLRSKV